jgi:hypothetical protein
MSPMTEANEAIMSAQEAESTALHSDVSEWIVREFKNISPEKLDIHVIAMSEKDTPQEWKLAGFDANSPIHVVELSPTDIKGSDKSIQTKNTPLSHGMTVFMQQGPHEQPSIMVMPVRLKLWDTLENKSARNGMAISLSDYFSEVRKFGESYAPSKGAERWATFGKKSQADQAFHARMVQEVIHTEPMERAMRLALEKVTGNDYEAVSTMYDMLQAAVKNDEKGVKSTVTKLVTMGSVDDRLAHALNEVRDLEEDTREDFEERSTWAYTNRDEQDANAIDFKKVKRVALGVAAAGIAGIGGGTIINETPTPIASSPQEAPAEVAKNTVQWGEGAPTSSVFEHTRITGDLIVPLSLPVEPSDLKQLDLSSLKSEGVTGLGQEWFADLPEEMKAKVNAIVANVEKQIKGVNPENIAEVFQSGVTELGDVLAANKDILKYMAAVTGAAAMVAVAVKNPRGFLVGLGSVMTFVTAACGGGATEFPTFTPAPAIETPSGEIVYTVENAKSAIQDHWGEAIAAEGSTIKSISIAENKPNEVALMEGENGTITLAAVTLTNDEQLLFMVKFDQAGNGTAYYLYPDVESYQAGKRIVYDAQKVDENNNITFAKFHIIAEKNGDSWTFSWLEEGSSDPAPFAPTPDTQYANFSEVVFRANPTAVPSIKLTPTGENPTPTPNAPKDGETKVVNGEILVWSKEFNSWNELLNEGGKKFPLLDLLKQSNEIGLPDQMWVSIFADQTIPGQGDLPSIIHVERAEQQDVPTFNSFLFTDLSKRLGKPKDLFVKINNGEVSLDFFTTAGEFSWKLGPDTNVNVYFRNMSDLPIEKDNGVREYTDPFDSSNKIRVKMYDVNGNFYSEVASLKPLNELSSQQIVAMILWGPLSVIDGPDQATQQHIDEVFRLTNNALNEQFPYFKVVGK